MRFIHWSLCIFICKGFVDLVKCIEGVFIAGFCRGGQGRGGPQRRGGRGRRSGKGPTEKVSAEDLDADLDKYHAGDMETN